MNVFYTNTIGELYNSPRKFEEGTIAISGEDQKQYCYTGNEWVMVGTTTNNLSDNSTTFQTGMNLYDFNKTRETDKTKLLLNGYKKVINTLIHHLYSTCNLQ